MSLSASRILSVFLFTGSSRSRSSAVASSDRRTTTPPVDEPPVDEERANHDGTVQPSSSTTVLPTEISTTLLVRANHDGTVLHDREEGEPLLFPEPEILFPAEGAGTPVSRDYGGPPAGSAKSRLTVWWGVVGLLIFLGVVAVGFVIFFGVSGGFKRKRNTAVVVPSSR